LINLAGVIADKVYKIFENHFAIFRLLETPIGFFNTPFFSNYQKFI
jgi:hypothetical protein